MRLVQQILTASIFLFVLDRNYASEDIVSFEMMGDSVKILIGGQEVTEYFVRDPSGKIQRPYFANVKTIEGVPVTRRCPPGPNDRQDHATMHPGIWLAFGDINGVDFWRNKGRVEHVDFVHLPNSKRMAGTFTTRKRYLDNKNKEVCEETFSVKILAHQNFYVLQLDSIFSGSGQFSFGDQEEMGLGLRVVSPLSEKNGGKVLVPTGFTTAKKFWGQPIAWCDFSGVVDKKKVGVSLFCSPQNRHQSWCHSRDYGLLVANCFGRNAMHQGEESQVDVRPGQSLRLQFAVLVHGNMDAEKINSIYEQYCSSQGFSSP